MKDELNPQSEIISDLQEIRDALNEADAAIRLARKAYARLHSIMYSAALKHQDRLGVDVASVIPKEPNPDV